MRGFVFGQKNSPSVKKIVDSGKALSHRFIGDKMIFDRRCVGRGDVSKFGQ